MAMETYRGRTFDTSTGQEWTAADSAAVRRHEEESAKYCRKCEECGQWSIDIRDGDHCQYEYCGVTEELAMNLSREARIEWEAYEARRYMIESGTWHGGGAFADPRMAQK